MTCRDCLHFDVCDKKNTYVSTGTHMKDLVADNFLCFKDKNKFVEVIQGQASDNEVVKILEDCFPRDHKFVTVYNGHTSKMAYVTLQDILNVISGQKREIEDLQKELAMLRK